MGTKSATDATAVVTAGATYGIAAIPPPTQACNELGQNWYESGVSENAVSGHIQLIKPGETACFSCAPPLIVASGIDEKTLKKDGVCAASLPTTMGIIAGFLVQNTLKYLLKFGTVSPYLGYSALKDFFPLMTLKPNDLCDDRFCIAQQTLYKFSRISAVVTRGPSKLEIELLDDCEGDRLPKPTGLPEGLEREYTTEERMKLMEEDDILMANNAVNLEELMEQMKKM